MYFFIVSELCVFNADRAHSSKSILDVVAEQEAVISKRMAELGSKATGDYTSECIHEPSLIFPIDSQDTQTFHPQRDLGSQTDAAMHALDRAKYDDIRTVLAWEGRRQGRRKPPPQYPSRNLPSPFDEKLALPPAPPKRRRRQALPPVIDAALRHSLFSLPHPAAAALPAIPRPGPYSGEHPWRRAPHNRDPSLGIPPHVPHQPAAAAQPVGANRDGGGGDGGSALAAPHAPKDGERPPAGAARDAFWSLFAHETLQVAGDWGPPGRSAAGGLGEPELARSEAASAMEATRQQLARYAVGPPWADSDVTGA